MNGDTVKMLEDEIEKALARVVRRLAKDGKVVEPARDDIYHWMAKAAVSVLEAATKL